MCSYLQNLIAVSEVKEFDDWLQFISWKEAEEANSYCQFVRPTGAKSTVGGKSTPNLTELNTKIILW